MLWVQHALTCPSRPQLDCIPVEDMPLTHSHRVAKGMCFLPPQMIHQGQGVLRHDRRPARDEKHVSEIKYSKAPLILTSPTHEGFWKIFPNFLPHQSFSGERFYARKQLKFGIFLIKSYMRCYDPPDPPCVVLNLKGSRASNPIYRTKSSLANSL